MTSKLFLSLPLYIAEIELQAGSLWCSAMTVENFAVISSPATTYAG